MTRKRDSATLTRKRLNDCARSRGASGQQATEGFAKHTTAPAGFFRVWPPAREALSRVEIGLSWIYLGAIVAHPEELYPMVKLKMSMDRVRRQIPAEPHWHFSYSMLQKVSRSFALVIQQLRPQLRNAWKICYLMRLLSDLPAHTLPDLISVFGLVKSMVVALQSVLTNLWSHVVPPDDIEDGEDRAIDA
ncbi:hypothetical protein ZIOFF_010968 [Zingiber officinale]|uniref:Uncharacterized protein n=1 Tax=Zingiber officinale TaxID=94328 RepID=A0A8J5LSE8_ZINOF|nr:hypothetical protein ZIOFF_010968 [Zingiber officinale]